MPHELLLTEPRSIRLGPYEDPPVAPDQVRAEAIVSGISHGTELALFRGVSPFDGKRFDADLRLFVDDDQTATYPMRLGYEWVGAVRETGAAVRTPQSGDLVHLALPHRETQTLTVEDDPRAPLTALPKGLDPERAALRSACGHRRGRRVLHRRCRGRSAARRGVAPQPADTRRKHERVGRAAPRSGVGPPASARGLARPARERPTGGRRPRDAPDPLRGGGPSLRPDRPKARDDAQSCAHVWLARMRPIAAGTCSSGRCSRIRGRSGRRVARNTR